MKGEIILRIFLGSITLLLALSVSLAAQDTSKAEATTASARAASSHISAAEWTRNSKNPCPFEASSIGSTATGNTEATET
jgi:hypothetical protein